MIVLDTLNSRFDHLIASQDSSRR